MSHRPVQETSPIEHSGIYHGQVRHRRFGAIAHGFRYQIYMMGLDLDELPKLLEHSRLFGRRWFNPIHFNEKDYLKNEPGSLKLRIGEKVRALGGDWEQSGRVLMLVQCRCMGFYFSPINFYFCYDQRQQCQYMLAEVSNTPWQQRHYYLLHLDGELKVKKAFHVSPFMAMDMTYHWRITPPSHKAMVHIENHQDSQIDQGEKVFDATLALSKRALSSGALFKTLLATPAMTMKMVVGIYWQALKLYLKRVPFVAHPESDTKT